MGLKLHDQKEIDDTISFRDMKNGQIGVIVRWVHNSDNLGTVVLLSRYGDETFLTALTCIDVWRDAFGDHHNFPDETHRVRLLPKGTLLEVQ